jgi:hypothetical protein
MSTQPTEAHRKLWTALFNLAHREIFEDYAESSDGPATQLIADSEARAVEAAIRVKSEVLAYPLLLADLTAERERVRVLREALESLAYWSRNKTESRITLRNRIAAALAATEEKP